MPEGLYGKYEVRKITRHEGTDAVSVSPPIGDCFVLRPDRDPAARVALLAYARATQDDDLARDLNRWVDAIQREIEPDEWKAAAMGAREAILADSARKADIARRELESAEFSLAEMRRVFATASERKEGTR